MIATSPHPSDGRETRSSVRVPSLLYTVKYRAQLPAIGLAVGLMLVSGFTDGAARIAAVLGLALIGAGAGWLLTRPATFVDPTGVRIRRTTTETAVPWGAVRSVLLTVARNGNFEVRVVVSVAGGDHDVTGYLTPNRAERLHELATTAGCVDVWRPAGERDPLVVRRMSHDFEVQRGLRSPFSDPPGQLSGIKQRRGSRSPRT